MDMTGVTRITPAEYRKRFGLSLREVSAMLGLNLVVISRWERGELGLIATRQWHRFAGLYGVDRDEFIASVYRRQRARAARNEEVAV